MVRNPARWLPDPLGKYQLRYWDGNEWTHHVASNGVQSIHAPIAEKTIKELDVIDVSDTSPGLIPARAKAERNVTRDVDKWLRLLPSWHSADRYSSSPQLEVYINDLYSELCNVASSFSINSELWSSSRLTLEQNESVIWAIYGIAENEVRGRYQQTTMDKYRSNFYDGLDSVYKKSEIEELKMLCAEFCKSMSPPDELTREKLYLTSNGYEYVWYDPDGLIRERNLLSDTEKKTLIFFYNSLTKYMEILEVRVFILKLYCRLLNIIENSLSEPWGDRTKSDQLRKTKAQHRVEKIFKSADRGIIEYEWDDIKLLSFVFKLCEQCVRENIPYPRYLNIAEKVEELRRDLPESLLADIEITIDEEVQQLELTDETILQLRELSPGGWKKHMEELNLASSQRCHRIMEWYREDPYKEKIYAAAVKKSRENQINNILCLYYYLSLAEKTKLPKSISDALIASIPDKQQRAVFIERVAKKNISNDNLVTELAALRENYIHKVILDDEKLEDSVKVYGASFVKVEEFLQENAIESNIVEESSIQNEKIDLAELLKEKLPVEDFEATDQKSGPVSFDNIFDDSEMNLLKKIDIGTNSLSTAEASRLAAEKNKFLESWIRDINQKFYDVYSDQLVIQSDGELSIDEEYVEYIKEILHGHKND